MAHEISEADIAAMGIESLAAVWYAHLVPITGDNIAAMQMSYSEGCDWWDWRVCPIHRWRLKYLMDWDQNTGPYSIPVLCGHAEDATSLEQGGSESDTDFLRRALRVLCGWSEYPES